MDRSEAVKNIIEYFEGHEDIFNECIEDLDAWNGHIGDDRYYYMEELGEIYSGVEPEEILRRAFYGYDAETWHTDAYGDKEYGAFNPNRDYFYFNGYGNLVSADFKDYSSFLDENTVAEMAEYRHRLYTIKDNIELSVLFDEYEEAEENEEA